MRIQFTKKNEEDMGAPQATQGVPCESVEKLNKPERILYVDNDILVAVKPAGILSQPGKGDSSDFIAFLRRLSPGIFSGKETPKLVHRLDRPVGGILLFTRSPRAERFYSPEGAKKNMKKTYIAVVCGKMPEQNGQLTDSLLRDGRTNLSRIVEEGTEGALTAQLRYEVLREMEGDDRNEFMQMLRIELLTGRHHQIRSQLAGAGCPVAGDTKYNHRMPAKEGWQRITLFADSLTIRHPGGREQRFYADPVIYEPEAFSGWNLQTET